MNPNPKQIKNPTTPEQVEEALKMLVIQGPEYFDMAQSLIDRNRSPFILIKNPDGTFIYRSQYTAGEQWLKKFITVDHKTIKMKEDALKASLTPYEVLICGSTGTGKELIAKGMIGKRDGCIRAINCAAMPRELIESELFGHKKGSFTGAVGEKEGLITAATKGVMFLDEIGELPLEHQSKLLRVIQEGTLRKVGGNEEEKIDCKFVFATNRDLKEMVLKKHFREDLYARIMALELNIGPIKDRMCDIKPICESLVGGIEFYEKFKDELQCGRLDLSLNVRSIQAYIRRYNTWGRI